MKITESVVAGEHYIGACRYRSRWPIKRAIWDIYLLKEATQSGGVPVWETDTREECVKLIEIFDAFVNRPAAATPDSQEVPDAER